MMPTYPADRMEREAGRHRPWPSLCAALSAAVVVRATTALSMRRGHAGVEAAKAKGQVHDQGLGGHSNGTPHVRPFLHPVRGRGKKKLESAEKGQKKARKLGPVRPWHMGTYRLVWAGADAMRVPGVRVLLAAAATSMVEMSILVVAAAAILDVRLHHHHHPCPGRFAARTGAGTYPTRPPATYCTQPGSRQVPRLRLACSASSCVQVSTSSISGNQIFRWYGPATWVARNERCCHRPVAPSSPSPLAASIFPDPAKQAPSSYTPRSDAVHGHCLGE